MTVLQVFVLEWIRIRAEGVEVVREGRASAAVEGVIIQVLLAISRYRDVRAHGRRELGDVNVEVMNVGVIMWGGGGVREGAGGEDVGHSRVCL